MTLRTDIKNLIDSSDNSEQSAIEILKLLEDRIGLDGNGWFDDDPDFQKLIREDDQLDDDTY